MKKYIAIILSALMLFTLLPASALAADPSEKAVYPPPANVTTVQEENGDFIISSPNSVWIRKIQSIFVGKTEITGEYSEFYVKLKDSMIIPSSLLSLIGVTPGTYQVKVLSEGYADKVIGGVVITLGARPVPGDAKFEQQKNGNIRVTSANSLWINSISYVELTKGKTTQRLRGDIIDGAYTVYYDELLWYDFTAGDYGFNIYSLNHASVYGKIHLTRGIMTAPASALSVTKKGDIVITCGDAKYLAAMRNITLGIPDPEYPDWFVEGVALRRTYNDFIVSGNTLTIPHYILKRSGIRPARYTVVLESYEYTQRKLSLKWTEKLRKPPADIQAVYSNSSLIITSNDNDWLYAVDSISLYARDGEKAWSIDNKKGKLTIPVGDLSANFGSGTYELQLYAYGYITAGASITISAAKVKPAPGDVTFSQAANGDVVITSSNAAFLKNAEIVALWTESEYNYTSAYFDKDQLVVSGSRLIIPYKNIVSAELLPGDYIAGMYSKGYSVVEDKKIKITKAAELAPPEVFAVQKPNGDIEITCPLSNAWLAAVHTIYAGAGGSVTASFRDFSVKDGVLTIPYEKTLRMRVPAGTTTYLGFLADGYTSQWAEDFKFTKGVMEAPAPSRAYQQSNGNIVIQGNAEWLSKVNQIEFYNTSIRLYPGKDFSVSGSTLTIPKKTLDAKGVMDGFYYILFDAPNYEITAAGITLHYTNPQAAWFEGVNKSMRVGQSQKLKLVVQPYYASNKQVTWSSSNKKIAIVSKTGVVKALKPGKVKIIAKTKYGNQKAVVTITVKK